MGERRRRASGLIERFEPKEKKNGFSFILQEFEMEPKGI